MHKTLITLAFKKAKNERKKIGDTNPSLVRLATDLSDYVDKTNGFSLGEKSYRNYLNDAKKLKGVERDIIIKQLKVLNGLYTYLGYENYEDFISDYPPEIITIPTGLDDGEDINITIKTVWSANKKTVIISFIILLSTIIIIPLNKTKWMVWQNGKYVETKFDTNKYKFQQLKIYNRNRILNFKQVDTTNCNTKFFKVNGAPNMWYGRNTKGELEYFTGYGKHPETGKTLKKITKYMIKKYICPNWK